MAELNNVTHGLFPTHVGMIRYAKKFRMHYLLDEFRDNNSKKRTFLLP